MPADGGACRSDERRRSMDEIRLLAPCGRAMHHAFLRRRPAIAAMHGAAVVPHDHVAWFPDLDPVVLRPRDAGVEFVQDLAVLIERQADNPGAIRLGADIEAVPSRLAMRAHDRM